MAYIFALTNPTTATIIAKVEFLICRFSTEDMMAADSDIDEAEDTGETPRRWLLAKFPHVQFPLKPSEILIEDIVADGPEAELNLSRQSSPRNDLAELDLEHDEDGQGCGAQVETSRGKRRRAWSQAIEDHIAITGRVNEAIYVTPREGLEGASQPEEQSPQTMLIINGRRRVAGARKAGLATILAFVLVGFKNLREAKRYAVVANLLTRQVGADHRKAGLHQLIDDEELMIATGEATHRSSHNLLGMSVGLDHEAVAKFERENWYARWLAYVTRQEKRLGQDEIPRLLRGDAWDCDKRFPSREVCLAPFCEAISRYVKDGQKFTQGLVEVVEVACLKRIAAVEAGGEPKPDDWAHHLRPYLLDCLAAVKEFARQQEVVEERARQDREEADKLVNAGVSVISEEEQVEDDKGHEADEEEIDHEDVEDEDEAEEGDDDDQEDVEHEDEAEEGDDDDQEDVEDEDEAKEGDDDDQEAEVEDEGEPDVSRKNSTTERSSRSIKPKPISPRSRGSVGKALPLISDGGAQGEGEIDGIETSTLSETKTEFRKPIPEIVARYADDYNDAKALLDEVEDPDRIDWRLPQGIRALLGVAIASRWLNLTTGAVPHDEQLDLFAKVQKVFVAASRLLKDQTGAATASEQPPGLPNQAGEGTSDVENAPGTEQGEPRQADHSRGVSDDQAIHAMQDGDEGIAAHQGGI